MGRASFGGSGDYSGIFSSLFQNAESKARSEANAASARAEQLRDADDADMLSKWESGQVSDSELMSYLSSRREEVSGDPIEEKKFDRLLRDTRSTIDDSKAELAYAQSGNLQNLINYYQTKAGTISGDSLKKRQIELRVDELRDKQNDDLGDNNLARAKYRLESGQITFDQYTKEAESAISVFRDSDPKRYYDLLTQLEGQKNDRVGGGNTIANTKYDMAVLASQAYEAGETSFEFNGATIKLDAAKMESIDQGYVDAERKRISNMKARGLDTGDASKQLGDYITSHAQVHETIDDASWLSSQVVIAEDKIKTALKSGDLKTAYDVVTAERDRLKKEALAQFSSSDASDRGTAQYKASVDAMISAYDTFLNPASTTEQMTDAMAAVSTAYNSLPTRDTRAGNSVSDLLEGALKEDGGLLRVAMTAGNGHNLIQSGKGQLVTFRGETRVAPIDKVTEYVNGVATTRDQVRWDVAFGDVLKGMTQDELNNLDTFSAMTDYGGNIRAQSLVIAEPQSMGYLGIQIQKSLSTNYDVSSELRKMPVGTILSGEEMEKYKDDINDLLSSGLMGYTQEIGNPVYKVKMPNGQTFVKDPDTNTWFKDKLPWEGKVRYSQSFTGPNGEMIPYFKPDGDFELEPNAGPSAFQSGAPVLYTGTNYKAAQDVYNKGGVTIPPDVYWRDASGNLTQDPKFKTWKYWTPEGSGYDGNGRKDGRAGYIPQYDGSTSDWWAFDDGDKDTSGKASPAAFLDELKRGRDSDVGLSQPTAKPASTKLDDVQISSARERLLMFENASSLPLAIGRANNAYRIPDFEIPKIKPNINPNLGVQPPTPPKPTTTAAPAIATSRDMDMRGGNV
jgi:hypothetical protein